MNSKPFFVLLCAFLVSTFIHGKPAYEESEECSDADKGKLQIRANSTTMRYGIFNESCNAGLILDIKDDIALLINGNEGTAVLIDLKTNETKYISSEICDPESFLDKPCLDLGDDESESDQSCDESKEVLDLVESIFGCLLNVDPEKIDPVEGLELIIEISVNIVELLQEKLTGILELSEKKFTVKQDLAGINNVLDGLSIIFGNISGGLEEAPVGQQELGDVENGIDFLALTLSNIDDIGENVTAILNDPGSLLLLLSHLGAKESTGVNGLLSVLGIVACYINGETKLEVVINTIIHVLAESSDGCNKNLKDSLDESLTNLLCVVDDLKYSECLSRFKSTIQDLLDGKLELDGVNLSDILENLLEGISDKGCNSKLTALVKIVLELTKSCEEGSEEEAILSVVWVLIIDVKNPLYLNLLIKLGIDITPEECSPNSSSTEYNSHENLYDILLSLPGVKEVTESLDGAVSEATYEKIDLKELINNENINDSIKAALQIERYVNLDSCEDDLEKVQELIEEIVSLGVYFGVDVCPSDVCAGAW